MSILAASFSWTWIAVAWLAFGGVVLVGIEVLSRRAAVDGPLSQEHWGYSLAMSIAAILGGPLLPLYGLAVGAGQLWRGKIPFSERAWWPARAKRQQALELARNNAIFSGRVYPPAEWLKERLTVEQIEAAMAEPSVEARNYCIIPSSKAWHAMKANMLPGDELRVFASPPASWQHRVGRAGVALVRNGQAIGCYKTMMN